MKPLYLIAEIYPNPEKLAVAKAAYQDLRRETLQEAGCICYDLVAESNHQWFMLEKWDSREAWDLHMESSHVKKIQQLEPLLTSKETKLTLLTEVE